MYSGSITLSEFIRTARKCNRKIDCISFPKVYGKERPAKLTYKGEEFFSIPKGEIPEYNKFEPGGVYLDKRGWRPCLNILVNRGYVKYNQFFKMLERVRLGMAI